MASLDSDDDDFGYDLSLEDEKLLASLADATHPTDPLDAAISNIATPGARHHDAAGLSGSSPRRMAALVGVARTNSVNTFMRRTQPQSAPSDIPTYDIQYPDPNKVLTGLEQEPARSAPPKTPKLLAEDDTKVPLLRFRTFPKKPLSVSDLTAGAWCELQYEYTLTRLPGGKKTRTVAMKEGSKVHQKLEDEIHTTVQVEISTREDAFGLKIWNIIQGLRTLRETGQTRELEVWGLVDGNVVNGLIDYLSYDNPNPKFEEEWLSSQGSQSGAVDESQKKITNFFPSSRPEQSSPADKRKVYLTDVKTRGAKNVPKGAAIRPTKVQLYLYHRFLSEMAGDKLDFLRVFERYGLDVNAPFSDSFLAQIGELHDDLFYDSNSVISAPSSGSETHDLLRYRTLKELVPLLRTELKLTFPGGETSIGSVVTVEYRLRGEEGALIGTNILAVDALVLDQYLEGYLQWWRGERTAAGVDIEEAYKCSSCEFAETCTWREDMDQGHLKRARERTAARSGVKTQLDATPRAKSPRRRRKSTTPS
ncbi:hypothetical protein N0V93_004227 [Gnomoniopsis smithogilvyi]|uniref:Defects in morphology protein 1 n=1 Tax=Gnomoniopsis smithogilvyi TaxID=1191159 RepID=A0A9W8YS90_9PEZI|nr:hypothetical protein N0V93_004227 [Gnomoniopsis smithogilvyi]